MNLALRFRPKKFDDILGQDELVELFKRFIKAQKLPHSMFFGNSGSGKTTFARVIANEFGLDFFEFDGGNFKLEELRKVLNNYKQSLYKPLIFIDEIHRLSKTQQEMLLIPMENYECIIIGASTDNPNFILTQGIKSRCLIFEFKMLNEYDLDKLLNKIINELNIKINEDAREFLINLQDARAMLNLIEFALLLDDKTIILENLKKLKNNISNKSISSKDEKYALMSAFIKSLRGSDVDASIYYLARLINEGEDALFIARRLVIFASEDISNADLNALNLAINTLIAIKNIGYPEARIFLSQCVVYLASAKKSNSSYQAINKALDYVKTNKALDIPTYLINSHPDKKDYLYPHDFGGYVKQRYLSKDLKFYNGKNIGDEIKILQNLSNLKKSL